MWAAAAAVNVIAAGCCASVVVDVGSGVGHALNFIFSSALEAPWESGGNNKPPCNIVIGNVVGSSNSSNNSNNKDNRQERVGARESEWRMAA